MIVSVNQDPKSKTSPKINKYVKNLINNQTGIKGKEVLNRNNPTHMDPQISKKDPLD